MWVRWPISNVCSGECVGERGDDDASGRGFGGEQEIEQNVTGIVSARKIFDGLSLYQATYKKVPHCIILNHSHFSDCLIVLGL